MPQMQRTSRYAGPALVVYVLALLIGTHLPGSAIQDSISENDKILHFAAYAVLGLLACNYMSARSVGSLRGYLLLYFSLAAFAAFDELTQIPVPGRVSDWGDWWSDMAGISVSLALTASVAQFRRSRLASLQQAG